MHRSGTSFTTSLLQNAGLHIGETLLGEHQGNLKGHFENKDFWDFHLKVLEENKLSLDGWDLKTIPFQKKYEEEAKKIIRKNQSKYWGWKDPRTTLFLDFWKQVLPDAKFLFVYRAPWEVVDSIYRRGDTIFNDTPEKAIDVWTFYNQTIFDFYTENRKNSALYHLEDFICRPKAVLEELNKRFDLKLELKDEKIFDEEIFNKKNVRSDFQQAIVKQYSPKATKLYKQLQQLNEGKKKFVETELSTLDSKMMYQYWHQLNKSLVEVNNLTKVISWMKKSRFWKLRIVWLRIKNFKVL
jgi:hypothetical protein